MKSSPVCVTVVPYLFLYRRTGSVKPVVIMKPEISEVTTCEMNSGCHMARLTPSGLGFGPSVSGGGPQRTNGSDAAATPPAIKWTPSQ